MWYDVLHVYCDCLYNRVMKWSYAAEYGYGVLAVAIISLCALLGLLVYPWHDTTGYKYVLSAMLGLAKASLVGDALLHLIPHVRHNVSCI